MSSVAHRVNQRAAFILSFALVIAGLAAWAIGESKAISAPPRAVMMKLMGRDVALPTRATQEAASVITFTRVTAVFGGILGLTAGLGGALISGLSKRSVIASVLGLLAGASLGAGTAYVTADLYYRHHESIDLDLLPSLLMHGIVWGSIGVACGSSFAIALGAKRVQFARIIAGGFLGALSGTIVYDVIGALLFAVDETAEPISKTTITRLLARAIVASGIAIGLVIGSRNTEKVATSAELSGVSEGN